MIAWASEETISHPDQNFTAVSQQGNGINTAPVCKFVYAASHTYKQQTMQHD
jgi:hypothetical protein